MKKLSALLLGGIIILVGVGLVSAGELRKAIGKAYDVPVLYGVYYDLDFMKKLKLGTAPYGHL